MASISKTVTCAGIMALVQEGRLDLDADINDYLPFEVHIPAAPKVPITMRHLLTHTSAIRDRANVWGTPWTKHTLYFHGDSPISLERFMRSYYTPGGRRYDATTTSTERAPGTRYSYSNLAVALAGFVAQRVSGVDFDAWCIRRILQPLGMAHSGYRLADIDSTNVAMPYAHNRQGLKPIYLYGYPDYPDGALRTSALHLARWLGAFMNFGSFQGARVLETHTVKEIRRNQLHGMVGLAPGPDLVQRRAVGLLHAGPHRRRLRREHADVLPARPAGRRRVADELVHRRARTGGRSATSSAACSPSSPDA